MKANNMNITLLGHIYKADEDDSIKKITFNLNWSIHRKDERLVGRLRYTWITTNMEGASKN